MIDPRLTLGALVTEHPSLARHLERVGLDYCCGGERTLAEACAAAGIELDDVVAVLVSALDDADDTAAWPEMDAVELVDHLVGTHHRYLWDELPRISALLDRIVDVHGTRHPELETVRECFTEIRNDLEPHMLKEERVLFPIVRELSAPDGARAFHCGTVGNPIAVMEREHESVGALLSCLRALTNGYQPPDDACATYRESFKALAELEADTHLHVHKENNVLFPMVVALEQQVG